MATRSTHRADEVWPWARDGPELMRRLTLETDARPGDAQTRLEANSVVERGNSGSGSRWTRSGIGGAGEQRQQGEGKPGRWAEAHGESVESVGAQVEGFRVTACNYSTNHIFANMRQRA